MKKAISLLLTALLLCGAAALADEPAFTDGVYTAVTQTGENQMTVMVTLEENLIKGVSLTADENAADVSSPDVTGMLQAIIAGQTLAVDVQSTDCTQLCEAILGGVEHCIRQAGGDVQALRTHHLCENQHGYHEVSGCSSHSTGSHHSQSSSHSGGHH